jgi:hypothetical protein
VACWLEGRTLSILLIGPLEILSTAAVKLGRQFPLWLKKEKLKKKDGQRRWCLGLGVLSGSDSFLAVLVVELKALTF